VKRVLVTGMSGTGKSTARGAGRGARRDRAVTYDARVVPVAELSDEGAGRFVVSPGWFVANVRDLRWSDKPGQGYSAPLTGRDEYEAETFFPMLGMAIRVARKGDVTTTYHWETEAEDFLVLAGEGLAILEGEEVPLKQWDFVHCPPETKHAFVGTGDEPFVLLCASSRQFQKDGPWGFYCFDDTAAKHNAASPEDTQDGSIAYARFAEPRETRYPDGLLPTSP
jgi:mannose-6-phosphate isomerase-like protein (cupin superfamily)